MPLRKGLRLHHSLFKKAKLFSCWIVQGMVQKRATYRQLADKERVRVGNKVLYDGCRYQLRLKATESTWKLIVTNTKHSHDMAMDPFSFCQHRDQDPNRGEALQQAQSLHAAGSSIVKRYKPLIFKGLVFQGMIIMTYQGPKDIIQRKKRGSLLLQS